MSSFNEFKIVGFNSPQKRNKEEREKINRVIQTRVGCNIKKK
jgi:hypothetical protein